MTKNIMKIIFIALIFLIIGQSQTREPWAAGKFYPESSHKLKNVCQNYLNRAENQKLSSKPLGIIVPHAGYPYSGSIAGIGFNEIQNFNYKTVFVLAPSHTERFDFASIYKGEQYKIPLGKVKIDQKLAQKCVQRSNSIKFSNKGHFNSSSKRQEHAIEVELPFLKILMPTTPIVPIVLGTNDYSDIKDIGRTLGKIAKKENVLIIASSDLSHYHSYSKAKQIDRRLISTLKKYDHKKFYNGIKDRRFEACGAAPITAMLITTKMAGGDKLKVLEYANSGDVSTGNKNRVVGYLTAGIVNSNHNNGEKSMSEQKIGGELNREQKIFLLDLAEKSMKSAVKGQEGYQPENVPERLKKEQGAFVTLNKNGSLRGCIGYVKPIKPLWEAVKEMAVSAALKDPRFPSVSENELDDIDIEISVLTVPREIDDIDKIEIGKHGLIMSKGPQRGLLLPQVATDNNWDKKTFLQQTCRKAGLPKQAWQETDTQIKIFSAQVFDREDVEE